jgi:hypothetical protein
MNDIDNFPISFRERMYLRVGYPIENRLLGWFGKRHDCGCSDLFGRRLRYCVEHAFKDNDSH